MVSAAALKNGIAVAAAVLSAFVPNVSASSTTACVAISTTGPAVEVVGVRTTCAVQVAAVDGEVGLKAASAVPHPVALNCGTRVPAAAFPWIVTVTFPVVAASPTFITVKVIGAEAVARGTLPKSTPVAGSHTLSTVPSRTLPMKPAVKVPVWVAVESGVMVRVPTWYTGVAAVGLKATMITQLAPAPRL